MGIRKYLSNAKTYSFILIKLISYITSMFPLSIYLVLKYSGDYTLFLDFIPKNIFANAIISIEIISVIILIIFFNLTQKDNCKIIRSKCNIGRYNFEELMRDKANTTNYLLANVLPILALAMDESYNFIFFIFLFVCMGYMYIKNDLFYNNPFYDFIGVKVYQAKVYEITYDGKRQFREISTLISKGSIYSFDNKEYKGIAFNDVLIVII